MQTVRIAASLHNTSRLLIHNLHLIVYDHIFHIFIPTNKPIIRKDANDLVYKTKREKYNAVIDEIVRLVEAGRPVLVGTTSVEVSELLSRMLKLRNIPHNVLNAKLHHKEADIVAEAGKSMLDHIPLFVSQAVHHPDDTLGAEQTHQIIFQRHEELG